MILDGLGIAGFRSFGEEMQYISDLSKVNIIIGKNNSGKSNVIRFLKRLSDLQLSSEKVFDRQLDLYRGLQSDRIRFSYQFKKNSFTDNKYTQILNHFAGVISKLPEWDESIWQDLSVDCGYRANMRVETYKKEEIIKKKLSDQDIYNIFSNKLGMSGGNDEIRLHHVSEIFENTLMNNFNIEIIDNFRKITTSDDNSWNHNGNGLISMLNKLKEPVIGKEKDKERYKNINQFLKEILNNQSASIEIPYTVNELYVEMDDKRLPLESLGTGIHQVIILAVAVTLIEKSVVCIEEPEVYLHPELQKKFLKFIYQNTDNQYIITTHSNSVFDCNFVNIYHCRLEAKVTKCNKVFSEKEKSVILDELGYKASDILQSNCIIWVEGPSDRIYMNYWLSQMDSELIEGIHYSIMFYGGRLLSHLTADDEEITEFIKLGKINRYCSILIDSDKRTKHTKINDTKKRIIKEFEDSGRFVWLTKGREIENYISEDTLNSSVRSLYGDSARLDSYGQFNDVTKFQKGSKGSNIDKIKLAKLVTQSNFENAYDLNEKLTSLLECIYKANGIESAVTI